MKLTQEDVRYGPRCTRSKEERWRQVLAHCSGPGAGNGLKALPSSRARWSRILRDASKPTNPVRNEADVAARLAAVERDAAKGDGLAAYVLAVARLLSVDLSE